MNTIHTSHKPEAYDAEQKAVKDLSPEGMPATKHTTRKSILFWAVQTIVYTAVVGIAVGLFFGLGVAILSGVFVVTLALIFNPVTWATPARGAERHRARQRLYQDQPRY